MFSQKIIEFWIGTNNEQLLHAGKPRWQQADAAIISGGSVNDIFPALHSCKDGMVKVKIT